MIALDVRQTAQMLQMSDMDFILAHMAESHVHMREFCQSSGVIRGKLTIDDITDDIRLPRHA